MLVLIDSFIIKDLEEIYLDSDEWHRFNGKTVLISGANGMIASYFVYFFVYLREIKSINVKIIAVVLSKERFEKCFDGVLLNTDYEVIETDLETPLEINGNVDYIIHAASPTGYNKCYNKPIEVIVPNVIGTKNLLDLAVKKKSEAFLLFSSEDIYGNIDGKNTIDEVSFGPLNNLNACSCYSESKRMAETLCRAYFREKNVPTKIARIWHVYAPTMDIENDTRIYSAFMGNIFRGEDIIISGNGKSKRSFCYITDAVKALMRISFYGKPGEAYNVCNTEELYSVNEIAEIISSLKKSQIVRTNEEQKTDYTNDIISVPSNKKVGSLGARFSVPVSEGFQRVFNYLEHKKN